VDLDLVSISKPHNFAVRFWLAFQDQIQSSLDSSIHYRQININRAVTAWPK